jgi:hypothetical protein
MSPSLLQAATSLEECMKSVSRALLALVALLAPVLVAAAEVTLWTPAAGDGSYAWNTKYGPYGYTLGAPDMGVGLYFGAPYGNDHTVSIFMVPLAPLAGQAPTAASLVVESLGFSTLYYYGSASIGWLDTGTRPLTGDIVADDLGPLSQSRPVGLEIFNTDFPATGEPGVRSFDVSDYVRQDLAAGRLWSTFVMAGSRDTSGAIRTAESLAGPRIVATGVVPLPASVGLLGAGVAALFARRRRAAGEPSVEARSTD